MDLSSCLRQCLPTVLDACWLPALALPACPVQPCEAGTPALSSGVICPTSCPCPCSLGWETFRQQQTAQIPTLSQAWLLALLEMDLDHYHLGICSPGALSRNIVTPKASCTMSVYPTCLVPCLILLHACISVLGLYRCPCSSGTVVLFSPL